MLIENDAGDGMDHVKKKDWFDRFMQIVFARINSGYVAQLLAPLTNYKHASYINTTSNHHYQ